MKSYIDKLRECSVEVLRRLVSEQRSEIETNKRDLDRMETALRERLERPCLSEEDHAWEYVRDEGEGLSGGGNYAMYRCEKCAKRKRVELPD